MNIQIDWLDIAEDFKIKVGLRTIEQLRECEILKAKVQKISRALQSTSKENVKDILDLEQDVNSIMRELADKTIKYCIKDWQGLTVNGSNVACKLQDEVLSDESYLILAQNETLLYFIYNAIEKYLGSVKKKLFSLQDLDKKTESEEK